ncbi:MAG: DUF5819 family protein [Microbacterium sp.]
MTGIIATIVVAIVMVGTAFVLAPAGTPLRSEVRAVAVPYFGQTWRVFAPGILKTNRTLEVRAQWREDGELVTSGWVSLTAIEQSGVPGNLAPSNIRKSTWNASGTYLKRYNALDDDQRVRVRDTFIERDGDEFHAIPVEELVADLGEGDADVIRFLRMDYMLMRLTTLYATAGFGQDIERVQWRVATERPNDFTHRFDEERQFEPNVVTFGWRQTTMSAEPEVVREYRAVVERFGATAAFEEAADVAE